MSRPSIAKILKAAESVLGVPGTLKRKSSSAVLWLWSGGLVRGSLGLVVTGLLARRLGAAPFGIFAVISAVIMFAIYIADSGISVALIQRDTVEDYHIRACHTYAVLQGIAVGLLTAAAAIPLAGILHNPQLGPPLAVSSISLPLAAWGTTSLALLRRQLRHRDAQWCQFAGYLVSQVGVALPLAAAGFGVWALVGGLVAQYLTQPMLLWLVTRHDVRPNFHRDDLSVRFTTSILVQNLSIWTLSSIDQIFLSRLGTPVSVGLYNRAKWATDAPNSYVVPAIQAVVLATTSRSKDDKRRLKSLLIKSIAICTASGLVVLILSLLFPSR